MKEKSGHDTIARRVARAHGGEYRPHKGADVIAPRFVGEVEVDRTKLGEGIRQLSGYTKPRYLIVPATLVRSAEKRTKGLKVGVMDEHGNVRKKAEKPAPRKPTKVSSRRR